MEKKETFEYTYSALTEEERAQIMSIKRQYEEKPKKVETDVERVKKLDAKIKNIPTCWALVLGVCGCLLFGTGLTMVLEWNLLIWGIVLMAIGCVPMIMAYPVFTRLTEKLKNKYAQEIIELSNKILSEEN